MTTQYWLMKSEPNSYSIDNLKKDHQTFWSGVRNYQARNFMRDAIKVGDKVLFYHSNAEPPGVVGIAKVCKPGYPDFTSWDPQNHHYDPKSTPQKPLWYMVDVEFVEKFPKIISLTELKDHPGLTGMLVLKRAMRLSVQPVSKEHFNLITHWFK